MGEGTSVKVEGGRVMRSVYSIPGALANQQKYTGQGHRVARTKKARTGKTLGAWLETKKEKRKKVQTKDAEEAIKAYDES